MRGRLMSAPLHSPQSHPYRPLTVTAPSQSHCPLTLTLSPRGEGDERLSSFPNGRGSCTVFASPQGKKEPSPRLVIEIKSREARAEARENFITDRAGGVPSALDGQARPDQRH